MKAFLKENIVLVAGIALPLLLTIIFFVTTQITKISTKDPQYSFLYTANQSYTYNSQYRVIVKNNKAYLSYIPPRNDSHNTQHNNLELYLYSPQTEQATLIELPEIVNLKKKQQILIKETADLNLSANKVSPDGYMFGKNYRRSGNLMTELFGSGYRNRSNHSLTKGPKTYNIPNNNSYYIAFVGWVLSGE